MLQKCITPLKSLLAVVLALSLVLMGQPAEALAGTAKVTFESDGKGTVSGDYDLDLSTSASVYESGAVVTLGELRNPDTIQPNTGYVFDYWTADVILYRARFFLYVDPAPIGYHISSFSEEFYTASDVTLTAHFKRQPAKVTYKTDGHGSVSKSEESVELNEEYPCGAETLSVGKTSGTTANPTDSTKYAYDYWIADKAVYKYENDQLTTVSAGTKLTSPEDYYVAEDVTFTAYFKQIAGDVTYKSAGHGSVSKESEEISFTEQAIDAAGTKAMAGTPTGSTPNPNDDYEFDYWTANVDVISVTDFSTLTAGSKITNDQLSSIYITKEAIFTAHFKHKPVTVTYKAEGNGSVDKGSESVEIDKEYKSGEETLPVGKLGGAAATPTDSTKYALDYWTADKAVYKYENNQLTTIDAGTKLTSIADYYVAEDVTFTAHFLRTAYDVTYNTAGHGAVSSTSERVAVGSTPAGCTITPDDGYEFEHWIADVSVEVADESVSQTSSLSANDAGSQAGTTTIAAGEPINDDQLKRAVSFSSDPVFTAHFKQKSTKTDEDDADNDSDDADNDSNDTDNTVVTNVKSVKSASGSSNASGGKGDSVANQIPSTGDTLAGTVVFFLCAAVASALTALVSLFSRRKHMGLHAR